jgi:uncharacterized protein DUF6785/uncharacterized protein DUF6784
MQSLNEQPAIRWRAFVLGVLLCALIGWWGPWGVCMLQGTLMFHFSTTEGAQLLLFLVVLFANQMLGRLYKPLRLSRPELVLVAVMMIVAGSLPTTGLLSYLFSSMAGPYYYASPENQWGDLVLPYVNTSLAPLDQSVASARLQVEPIRQFFEGLEPGQAVPWRAWLAPLGCYAIVLGALYLVMIAVMVIIRRQWIDNERLAYPITQLPRELINTGDPTTRANIFRSPIFWIAVAIPFAYFSHKALERYFPETFDTPFRLYYWAWAMDRSVRICVYIHFAVLGFAFLIDRRIALSMWVFSLLTTVETGLLQKWGVGPTQQLGTYIPAGTPAILHQGAGALVMFVAATLWTARSHLRDVARKALFDAPDVDDSQEILSYRSAVILLAVGLAVMMAWLVWAGLSLVWAAVFLLTAMVTFFGLSRAVCESGLFLVYAPIVAPTFLTNGFGSEGIGAVGILALAACWPWCADTRNLVMTAGAHGLRLVESSGTGRRHMFFWAMIVAIVVVLVVATVLMLLLAYEHGGINLRYWFFISAPNKVYSNAASLIGAPTGPNWDGWGWAGGGAVVTGLLVAANRLMVNWPLHPVGFVLSHINYAASMWFSVFLAWLTKVVVVRWFGPRGFAIVRPFFIGLILGQFAAGGFWLIVDFFTGFTGNKLF